MTPVEFKEQNVVYTRPQNMTDEECGSLPAYRDGAHNISCHKMNLKERLKVLFTGVVWLDVYGSAQPPIWLGVDTPFIKEA